MTTDEYTKKDVGHRLAFIFALPEEARGMLKAGEWERVPSSASRARYLGSVASVNAVLAVSGIGRANAEEATREVIEQYKPDAIVSLGFAGGLTAGDAVGDLVVADTLMPIEGTRVIGEPIDSASTLVQTSRDALEVKDISARFGLCLTTSHIASNPEAKTSLGKTMEALAVEMESYWIGQACRDNNVPFLAVRSIVDTVDHLLPSFVAEYTFEAGMKSRWRQVLPVLLRPWCIPGLLRLGAASARSQKSLTTFAVALSESYAQESIGHIVVESE